MPNYIDKSAFCSTCNTQRLVRRKGASGFMTIVHGFLTVITLGLWGFFWRGHAEARQLGGYRCTTCGTQIHDLKAAATVADGANFDDVIRRDLGAVERMSVRSSIKAVAAFLADQEPVRAAVAGTEGSKNVLFVATENRVVRAEGDTVSEIPGTTSASSKVGFAFGTVNLQTTSGPVEVKKITPPERAEAFALVVQRLAAAPTLAARSEEKICPMCAESVKAAARVCRFCGHQFEEQPSVGPP